MPTTSTIRRGDQTLHTSPSPTVPSAPAANAARKALADETPPSGNSLTGWAPTKALNYNEWIVVGQRLGCISRCSQWWVGDWIRYGAKRWGEKYTDAAQITGYDVRSLRNMAWLASRFDLSRRRDNLTWSHHACVATLTLDEQDHWLDRANIERMSVADLRLELKSHVRQRRMTQGTPKFVHSGSQTPMTCPKCGFEIPAHLHHGQSKRQSVS